MHKVFSIVKKKIFITNNSKKQLSLYSKPIKNLNSKFFFYNWNQHAEYRSSYNLSRTYLLTKKLWYFQKKQFSFIPYNLKKQLISDIYNVNYKKLQSKLIDFIKKIF